MDKTTAEIEKATQGEYKIVSEGLQEAFSFSGGWEYTSTA
jgi:hypothetical protein